MSGSWTFVLTDAGGNPLAELSTASGRTIAFKRNSYVEVNLTLSHEDDAAALLLSALGATGVPRLKAYRRGPNDTAGVLKFRGPLMGLQETSEETSLLTATFRSPFSVLVGDGDKSGRFLTSQFPTIYNAKDAGLIANALIDTTNRDAPTGLATNTSLVVATTARNATYPVGQNIGSAIMNLSALLDGFDFFETFAETGTLASVPALGAPTNLIALITSPATWLAGPGSFFWVVTAITGSGESNASNELSVVVSPGFMSLEFTLAWDAFPGALSYNVYRGTSSGGEASSPALVANVGTNTYIDAGTPTTTGAVGLSGLFQAEAYFNVAAAQGAVVSSARFEYGPTTLSNVVSMNRTTTPPLNTLFVTGGNGLTSIYSDATSIVKYGKWWGHYDFPDIIDQAQLDAKARALTRPNPVKTVTLVPELGLDNCPKPFDDWNLGDTVSFFAARGALSENTSLRINGFTIPVDESGFETVSVNDPTQPEEDAVVMAQLTAEVDITG